MGFWDWLRDKLAAGSVPLSGDIWSDPELNDIMAEFHIRELAFETAANLIANSISKCEFKTFVKNKETKGDEYYLWNVEPNQNQSSTAFLHKLVHHLLKNNEALVVEGTGGSLLVADSFQRKQYAMFDDTFTGVQVEDFTFNKAFLGSDVLYFRLNCLNVKRITDSLYSTYARMIQRSMNAFIRSRGTRGKMLINAMARGDPKFEETLREMQETRLKKFFASENGVLPLFEGWTYEELGNKTYANDTTRDIRAMVDDISDFTAKGFCIPPALLRGDVAGLKDALKLYLTFCVDPLVDNLQEEINRKRVGRSAYLAGTYIQIDTKTIEHIDLLSVSTAIDKLIASGAFCINDIRKAVGEQLIDEEWANQHWMTKNYSPANELLEALQGGDAGG